MKDKPKKSVTPKEMALIRMIVIRAEILCAKHNAPVERDVLLRAIVLCHKNGNPLDLVDLLTAPDFDLMLDVGGINHHLDRRTGKLKNCFLPRYSK